jgi:acetylornithine/N-succinyldiaminopimelate aminotransferase
LATRRWSRPLIEQGQKLWHVSNWMTNEPVLRLARKMSGRHLCRSRLLLQLRCRGQRGSLQAGASLCLYHYGIQKDQIIAFQQGFHGRTLFTVSVGGQACYSDGFGPKPGQIDHVPYNDLAALKALISAKTCAVVMEPLQGEGGVLPADPAFAKAVRELCDQHQALLIFDEVQTGMGRTGSLFAYMQLGIRIFSRAQGAGGRLPIGALRPRGDCPVFKPGSMHHLRGIRWPVPSPRPLSSHQGSPALRPGQGAEGWFREPAVITTVSLFREVRGRAAEGPSHGMPIKASQDNVDAGIDEGVLVWAGACGALCAASPQPRGV